jgi:tRNA(Ile)-lysidine synthase
MMLISKVSSYISQQKIIFKNDHIIIALSGGRDSVVLFHLLKILREKINFKLSALHINHGLRGKESDEDENFVKHMCRNNDIHCYTFQLSGYTLDSGENVLRKERYRIFEQVLNKERPAKIATAHHLDDQLETFLMRLFKGSGSKGLLGIPVQRPGFIRPLLHCTREEINRFCSENNIQFREDSSNLLSNKLRNQVRLDLIPVIERIFGEDYLPDFNKSHQDFKQLFEEHLQLNRKLFKNISHLKNDCIDIKIRAYFQLSVLQRVRFLDYCFYELNGLTSGINSDQISEFEKFAENSQTGSKFIFHENCEVLKNRGDLIFSAGKSVNLKSVDLFEEGITEFGSIKIAIKKISHEQLAFNQNRKSEFINGDNIVFPLQIRKWKDGDYFYPLGSVHKQKLSDFFINVKVSKEIKQKIPVVVNDREIVWLAGYRLSERYKVKKSSEVIYNLQIIED